MPGKRPSGAPVPPPRGQRHPPAPPPRLRSHRPPSVARTMRAAADPDPDALRLVEVEHALAALQADTDRTTEEIDRMLDAVDRAFAGIEALTDVVAARRLNKQLADAVVARSQRERLQAATAARARREAAEAVDQLDRERAELLAELAAAARVPGPVLRVPRRVWNGNEPAVYEPRTGTSRVELDADALVSVLARVGLPPCRTCAGAFLAYRDTDRLPPANVCPHGVHAPGTEPVRHARRTTVVPVPVTLPPALPVPVCPTCGTDLDPDGRCADRWCQLRGKLIPLPEHRAPGSAGRAELDAAIAHLAGFPLAAPEDAPVPAPERRGLLRRIRWGSVAASTSGVALIVVQAVRGEIEPLALMTGLSLISWSAYFRGFEQDTDERNARVVEGHGPGLPRGESDTYLH